MKVWLVQCRDPDVRLISQIDIVMCFIYNISAMSWQYRGRSDIVTISECPLGFNHLLQFWTTLSIPSWMENSFILQILLFTHNSKSWLFRTLHISRDLDYKAISRILFLFLHKVLKFDVTIPEPFVRLLKGFQLFITKSDKVAILQVFS